MIRRTIICMIFLKCLSVKCEFMSCGALKSNSYSIGCVSQALIPLDQSYWVEFKDEETNNRTSVCLETCINIYTNTR